MKILKRISCCIAVFAAATIGLSSCSDEMTPNSPINEGEVNVVMTTSLPGELTTYGSSSADGGLINLAGKGYLVRYVMEVYPKGSDTRVVRMINYKSIDSDPESARSTSFETRLMASEYNFVFYADIVHEVTLSGELPEGLSTPCYGNRYFFSNTDDTSDVLFQPNYLEEATEGSLKAIKATYNAESYYNHTSTEQYDIYTCKENVDLRYESSHSFTLKRPFAKLRIITTDSEDLEEDKLPDWNKTVVTLGSSNSDNAINNEYNAVDGTYSVTGNGRGYWMSFYQTTNAQSTETYDEEDETGSNNGERTLGVFYIPVSNGSYNLDFSITTHKGNTKIIENLPISVENVPLVANKLTTIKGKLLTKKFVSEITVADLFEDPETIIELDKEASDLTTLMSSLTGSTETITYTGAISKEEGLTLDFTNLSRAVPVYEEGNTAVLTLNIGTIEEGSVITVIGGANAPKEIVLNTGAKCSVRANLTNTRLTLGGSYYINIVYNCALFPTKPEFPIDAIFIVDNDRANVPKPTNNSAMHKFVLDSDFMVTYKMCNHDDDSNISSYFEENTDKSAWDYVEDNK